MTMMTYNAGDWTASWYSYVWYPSSFTLRVSPINAFNALFNYNYYPQADFQPAHPDVVNAGEWHNIAYTRDTITSDTTFTADDNNLVHRYMKYDVSLDPVQALAQQYAIFLENGRSYGLAFSYWMDAPRERLEYLSPDPILYADNYWTPYLWQFSSYLGSYQPGQYHGGIGGQPLTSGANVNIIDKGGGAYSLHLGGYISRDPFGNVFFNNQVAFPGTLNVSYSIGQIGVGFGRNLENWIDETVDFNGTPSFTVTIEGTSPLPLSTRTLTQLEFTGDIGQDYRPPWINIVAPAVDQFGVVPNGTVNVNPTGGNKTVQFEDIYKDVTTGVESLKFTVLSHDGRIFIKVQE